MSEGNETVLNQCKKTNKVRSRDEEDETKKKRRRRRRNRTPKHL